MEGLGWLLKPAVFPWVALATGLCIGSFLNVVIHRLPRMLDREWRSDATEILRPEPDARQAWRAPERQRRLARRRVMHLRRPSTGAYNLVVPRSACPRCGHAIRSWENIPVVSYAFLGGRCASCRAPIGVRYPVIELLAGVGAAYAAWRFGPTLKGLGAAFFLWFTIALAFIDHDTGFLPDDLTLPLLWLGLLANLAGAFVPLSEAVVGAMAGYLSLWTVFWGYKLLTGKDGMGYGDFKMNAAVGAFVGWKVLPLVLLISSVVGVVFGALQMFAARKRWDAGFRFHFGPYIAIAGVVALFWGEPLMRWYLPR
jgi:leader peptidase (prepilin peptidase)/N-methyltransferase